MLTPDEVKDRVDNLVWRTDPAALPGWRGALVLAARMAQSIGRDLVQGYLPLQATSLVYTTLLSLVPLLAVSFSVLKGFGVHNQIEPLLLQLLEPLGDKGEAIAKALIGYVDNTAVGVLGSVGLALLIYSVVSLISKVEQVFNYTWRVEQPRPLAQRFSQYLSVLLIGPVLFFSALGATLSLRSTELVQHAYAIEPLGLLLDSVGRLVPYALIVLVFMFMYAYLPNTQVRARSALVGALVAGVLWQSAGRLFATFMAGSTQYAAIYSGLAIPILFMIWVYIAWLILLIGANIAFYHQYPEYLGARVRDLRLSNRLRERVALCIAAAIAARHHDAGDPPWTAEGLSHRIGAPLANVQNLLRLLERGGFVLRTAGDPPRFVPARSPSDILVADLLDGIRRYGEDDLYAPIAPAGPVIAALEGRVDQARAEALAGLTLEDLARDGVVIGTGTGAGAGNDADQAGHPG